jgi:hypothetical protein
LLACGPLDVNDPEGLEQCAGCVSDGFDDPAGSGHVFFVEDYLPTPDQELTWALDIDEDGHPDQALNHLSEQYQLLGYNFTEFVRSGSMLGVLELAGVEAPYTGDDDAVTAKIYQTVDADHDLSNNTCEGEGCAQFTPNPDFMLNGQTLFRFGPAPIVDHHLRIGVNQTQALPIDIGEDIILPFLKVRMEIRIPDTLDAIPAGVMCGAMPAVALDEIPLCEIASGAMINEDACIDESSLAFMVARLGAQPDIDLDGDGLETYEVDFSGSVLRCHDADGTVIEGATCLSDPRIADGFSICASFRGIPGELILR